MKLYTEEQLRNSMLSMKTYIFRYNESVIDSIIEKHIKALGVVELPSDEEIKKQNPFVWGSHVYGTRDLLIWEEGVIWLRDKIQGGNK